MCDDHWIHSCVDIERQGWQTLTGAYYHLDYDCVYDCDCDCDCDYDYDDCDCDYDYNYDDCDCDYDYDDYGDEDIVILTTLPFSLYEEDFLQQD